MRTRRRSILAFVLVGAVTTTSLALAQMWPPEIKNLKVLDAETEFNELLAVMRGFSQALEVRCQHCHVGEEGQPLSEFDFAADAKETKNRARVMMRMTQAINSQHLKDLHAQGGAVTVECVTCHRGATRPEQLSDVLARTVIDDDIEQAVLKYAELREEYFGRSTYDFGEKSLLLAAEVLLEKNAADAIRLLELNRSQFPDSQRNSSTLASAYEQAGRKEDALALWKELLEDSPQNSWIKGQIQRLEG